MKPSILQWVVLIILVFGATNCASTGVIEPETKIVVSPSGSPGQKPTETIAPQLTQSEPEVDLIQTISPSPAVTETPEAVMTTEPSGMQISFPTSAPVPISAWRPPLYAVPLAIGQNDHFYFLRPIPADEINWPLADYRYGGVFFSPDVVHTGIDIDARTGADVLASAAGEVIWAGYGLLYGQANRNDPYGLAVALKHDFGYKGQRLYTIYAHMSEIQVLDGEYLEAGDVIGKVGETGHTTGPHLHFEVRLGKNIFANTRNPELWLAPPQGWGVLVGKITDSKGKPLNHVEVYVTEVNGNRSWIVRTYKNKNINADDYFNENLVLSDLPAGEYRIRVEFENEYHWSRFTIHPGAISYLTFIGEKGYDFDMPDVSMTDEITFSAP